jgi:hypothetical protein
MRYFLFQDFRMNSNIAHLILLLLAATTITRAQQGSSVNLLNNNVKITWNSNGTHTAFQVTSPLGGSGVSTSDAWLSIGLNTDKIMVI